MEDPTTIALNLTFFGTLAVAFLMFLGLFTVFAATLVIAGIGRLAATVVMAVADVFAGTGGRDERTRDEPAGTSALTESASASADTVNPPRPARMSGRKAPALSQEWTTAVAGADARAAERARAQAGQAVAKAGERQAG